MFHMFHKSAQELNNIGATTTTHEIARQPESWRELVRNFVDERARMENFLADFGQRTGKAVQVIFAGAGSSAHVGDIVAPYLTDHGDRTLFSFKSVPTTNIVARPKDYLDRDQPTILVSLSRSGNSPESVAAFKLANKLVEDVAQLVITCTPDSKLAVLARDSDDSLVLTMPENSNDESFSMTSSFSSMVLACLLVFDNEEFSKKKGYIENLAQLGEDLIANEDDIEVFMPEGVKRVVYLGSSSLNGAAAESRMKIIELTAGKLASMSENPLALRHGPKAFIDKETVVFGFLSNEPYSRQYDIDILNELRQDEKAIKVVGVGQQQPLTFPGEEYIFPVKSEILLPDAYLAVLDVLFGQTVALNLAVRMNKQPDNPDSDGSNRVVKGVTIHKY